MTRSRNHLLLLLFTAAPLQQRRVVFTTRESAGAVRSKWGPTHGRSRYCDRAGCYHTSGGSLPHPAREEDKLSGLIHLNGPKNMVRCLSDARPVSTSARGKSQRSSNALAIQNTRHSVSGKSHNSTVDRLSINCRQDRSFAHSQRVASLPVSRRQDLPAPRSG